MGMYTISWNCLLPCVRERDAGEYILYGASNHCTTMSVCQSPLLASRGSKTKQVSQTSLSHLLNNNWIAAKRRNRACKRDSLSARITTVADWVAAKVVERQGPVGEVVENEDGGDVPKMVDYKHIISSKMAEEWVVRLLVPPVFPFCLLRKSVLICV